MKQPEERFVFRAESIKGSRFEAWIGPAPDEESALALLEEVRATTPNATHHCWAYRLADGRSRSSDDGEPGGSAGRPILAQLEGHEVVAMAVVVRWYGGTKLGVGGLMRAYGGTAGQALDRAPLVEHVPTTTLSITHSYGDAGPVEIALAQVEHTVVDQRFEARVVRRVRVRSELASSLRDVLTERTSGRVVAVLTEDR